MNNRILLQLLPWPIFYTLCPLPEYKRPIQLSILKLSRCTFIHACQQTASIWPHATLTPIQKAITFPAKPVTDQDANMSNILMTSNMKIPNTNNHMSKQASVLVWSYNRSWLLVQCFLDGNQSMPILKHEPEESTESTNTYLPVNEYVLFLHLLVVSRHVFQRLAWPSTILEVGYSET